MKYALVVIALVACKKSSDRITVALPAVDFNEVATDLPPGTSDLSLDDHEHLWAIAERDRVVAEIVLTGQPLAAVVTLHPLRGVPDGLDTESLAWLGGGKFAVGTEGQDTPTASVMFGELRPDGYIAFDQTVRLTNDQLGVELTVNHGAEGMCGHGDDLIVAIETFGTNPNGSRWSPLVRMHTGVVTRVQKLLLTSDGGKISALFCTFAADGTADVLAIERHYGVSRIITFTAPPTATEITPKIALELWPMVRDRYNEKLNLEGIVKLADGSWVLVNDNQGTHVEGSTKLFVFPTPAQRRTD